MELYVSVLDEGTNQTYFRLWHNLKYTCIYITILELICLQNILVYTNTSVYNDIITCYGRRRVVASFVAGKLWNHFSILTLTCMKSICRKIHIDQSGPNRNWSFVSNHCKYIYTDFSLKIEIYFFFLSKNTSHLMS